MQEKAGVQINLRIFIQSVLILLVLMLLAGALTIALPTGQFTRLEVDGRESIVPGSYTEIPRPDYPFWRWFTAPLEVLAGPDSLVLIVIILFLLFIGGAFAVLDASGVLVAAMAGVVRRFGSRKYVLLLVISFLFMLIGATLGLFEEMVPFVPLMLALAYSLGWDTLTGLGMSILAVNMGFSAAISNPFTLGVAQRLAGLPLFSGVGFRIAVFIAIYFVLAAFLVWHARRVERNPRVSLTFAEDEHGRKHYSSIDWQTRQMTAGQQRGLIWFLACAGLMTLALLAGPFVPALGDLALPLVAILFLIGGVGAGFLSGMGGFAVLKALWQGVSGIAPGVVLILMAASVRHIVESGAVMDTLLFRASTSFSQTDPFLALLGVYGLALLLEFFIGSGSAKAFLLMPVLLPLADLVGVTRQLAVTAYQFGDGFSNLAYPTNPVLLIVLGLSLVSYGRWLRWTLPLWGLVLLVTLVFLWIGLAINLGPF